MASIERFFFQPLRFRGLFVMRAAFGLVAVFYYLRLLPYVQVLFGPAGVNGHDTARRWPGFPMAVTENLEHFGLLADVADPSLVWALYGLLLLTAVSFTLGLFTRVAGVLLALLHAIFASHQPTLSGGWVKLYPALVLYLTVAPSGAAWSLDAWRKRRRDPTFRPSNIFSPWALRVLQVHVIAMYATAGWPRVVNPAWLRGESVFRAAADMRYGRWDLNWHALHALLTVASYYALVLEPAATLLLPWRLTRRWCALALIALHLGIELVADVGMWGFVMIAAVSAFLPDRWFCWIPGLKDDHFSRPPQAAAAPASPAAVA
jgi:hypothetical protein